MNLIVFILRWFFEPIPPPKAHIKYMRACEDLMAWHRARYQESLNRRKTTMKLQDLEKAQHLQRALNTVKADIENLARHSPMSVFRQRVTIAPPEGESGSSSLVAGLPISQPALMQLLLNERRRICNELEALGVQHGEYLAPLAAKHDSGALPSHG